MSLPPDCLANFLVQISESLALPNRNNAQLVRNTRNAVRAFNANAPNLDLTSALREELFSVEQASLKQGNTALLFEVFLFAVIIAIIVTVVVAYVILTFDLIPALVIVIVIFALTLLAFFVLFSFLRSSATLSPVETNVLTTVDEVLENQFNAAFCAYSGCS